MEVIEQREIQDLAGGLERGLVGGLGLAELHHRRGDIRASVVGDETGERRGLGGELRLCGADQALDAAGFNVDYLTLRNARTLAPVTDAGAEPLRLLVAARLGRTRLIDNLAV